MITIILSAIFLLQTTLGSENSLATNPIWVDDPTGESLPNYVNYYIDNGICEDESWACTAPCGANVSITGYDAEAVTCNQIGSVQDLTKSIYENITYFVVGKLLF